MCIFCFNWITSRVFHKTHFSRKNNRGNQALCCLVTILTKKVTKNWPLHWKLVFCVGSFMLLQNCGMNNLPQKVQSLKNHVSDLSPEHGLRPEGRVDHPTPFSHPHPCLGSEIIKYLWRWILIIFCKLKPLNGIPYHFYPLSDPEGGWEWLVRVGWWTMPTGLRPCSGERSSSTQNQNSFWNSFTRVTEG